MKKICHITTVHPLGDNRILYKECTSLKEKGYDVSLIVTADNDDDINGVKIVSLDKGNNSRLYRMTTKRKEALRKALEVDADIYHFHDPELMKLGCKLIKKGKKVIYDVHEDMPKQILTKSYLGPMPLRRLISKAYRTYEMNNCKKFSGIVTVQDDMKERFSRVNNKCYMVKNYAKSSKIKECIPIPLMKDEEGKLICIYVGSITKIRGVVDMINAIEKLNGDAILWLLGPWESEELKRECETLPGYKYTKYKGCVSPEEVHSYIKSSHLGLSVLHNTPNYYISTPTKVFEYMGCRKPIILSDFPYWRELFGNVGEYVEPNNPEILAEAIKRFVNNPEKIKYYGEKNETAFLEEYSWEQEEKELFKMYEEI